MSQFIYPPVSVDTTGLATEATLLLVEANTADTVTELQSANSTLSSIDGKDFATQTTLASVLTSVQATATSTASIDTKVATQTTLASVDSRLQTANTTLTSIDGKDFATETSLQSAITELQTLNTVDFATEPTLQNVVTEVQNAVAELQPLNLRLAGSLTPVQHDELVITYVGAGNGAGEISTVTYKLASSTVAVLTMSYDSNNRLTGVVRT